MKNLFDMLRQKLNSCRLTHGERIIMGRLEDLEAAQKEVVVLLKTIDAQVEALFEVIKQPDVSESAAARLTLGLNEIKAAAEAIATDDAPVVEEPTPSE